MKIVIDSPNDSQGMLAVLFLLGQLKKNQNLGMTLPEEPKLWKKLAKAGLSHQGQGVLRTSVYPDVASCIDYFVELFDIVRVELPSGTYLYVNRDRRVVTEYLGGFVSFYLKDDEFYAADWCRMAVGAAQKAKLLNRKFKQHPDLDTALLELNAQS